VVVVGGRYAHTGCLLDCSTMNISHFCYTCNKYCLLSH